MHRPTSNFAHLNTVSWHWPGSELMRQWSSLVLAGQCFRRWANNCCGTLEGTSIHRIAVGHTIRIFDICHVAVYTIPWCEASQGSCFCHKNFLLLVVGLCWSACGKFGNVHEHYTSGTFSLLLFLIWFLWIVSWKTENVNVFNVQCSGTAHTTNGFTCHSDSVFGDNNKNGIVVFAFVRSGPTWYLFVVYVKCLSV
jgi:hypothetical protein